MDTWKLEYLAAAAMLGVLGTQRDDEELRERALMQAKKLMATLEKSDRKPKSKSVAERAIPAEQGGKS